MVFGMVTRRVQLAQERAFKAQKIAQSGVRVEKASDDPLAAARGNVLNGSLERLRGMEQVSARAKQELAVGESALGEGSALFNRARELAVQGANATYDAESRRAMAQEVAGLREQMISIANTRVANVFIFGGY